MAMRSFGVWNKGWKTVSEMLQFLDESMMGDGISINQLGTVTITYRHIKAHAGTPDSNDITAIKASWEG